MPVVVKFECGMEDRESEGFGPYDWVQLTYNSLRVSNPEDKELALFDDGYWILTDLAGKHAGQYFSDVVIS